MIFFHLMLLSLIAFTRADSEVIQLTETNKNDTFGKHEIVFINFYADWCPYSRMLTPIFEEASIEISRKFPNQLIRFARTNCDNVNCDGGGSGNLCCEFGISKFPTLGHVRKGVKHRKEYRGQRTKQALVDHATRLAEDPIVLLDSVDHFRSSVLPTRATLLAFTDEPANRSEAYDVYRDVSHSLRDDCDFYWVSGLAKTTFADHNQNDHIAFKAAKESWLSSSNLSRFDLPLSPRTFKDFLSWASRLCLPVVREITFDNAEELTEERLPFVILFYVGQYQKSIRLFREVIERELMHEYGKVNFLLADGDRFHYPLMHLGRTKQDLPLIVIDSFQHMFMFPNYEHIKIPGRLKSFIEDLHSGKLHREYHFGPDPTEKATPPESKFKNLQPSPHRYTLLKDEL